MAVLKDYDIVSDGEIDLVLNEKSAGNVAKGFVSDYKFHILLHKTKEIIGHINLRIGYTEKVIKYIGHIGYGIKEAYRGNR